MDVGAAREYLTEVVRLSEAYLKISHRSDFSLPRALETVGVTVQAAGLFPNAEWQRVLRNKRAIFNAGLQ
jgi:hypothetical protein